MNLFQHYGKSIPTYKEFLNNKKIIPTMVRVSGYRKGYSPHIKQTSPKKYYFYIGAIGGMLNIVIKEGFSYEKIEMISNWKTGNAYTVASMMFVIL